ncbi:hypothetical protein FRC03_006060 [Tulasnella sp. 419]|nr:hypothetical protein FRC02_001094 [Tulasnella sp. 418]KAG8960856.1 hypothetical protein FRC03_006060 [Tulasnella sp. 419]
MTSYSSPGPVHSQLPHHSPALRPALKHLSRPTSPHQSPTHSPPMSPPSNPNTQSSPIFPRSESHGSNNGKVGGGGYTTKVSFDTFMNPSEDALFSFTLQVKSEGYRKTRNTRVYLCAASEDESGRQALEWTLDSLIEDGDELVVVRGFDTEELVKDREQVREDAKDLMKRILDKNTEYPGRGLSVIVEFVAGKVTETIDRMTALYRPDSLIVGTRGQRSLMQTWGAALGAPGMGSVSRYCVSHSPVPVIVVRPERKVKKSVEKRKADPKRRAVFEELSRIKTTGGAGLSF